MIPQRRNWLPLLGKGLAKESLSSNVHLLISTTGILHLNIEGSNKGEFQKTVTDEEERE